MANVDIDGSIYDVITCKRLGRHMQHQGTLIACLVGIAIEGMANALGIAATRESQPTEEQLQRFIGELNSLPPRPDINRMMLAERYITLDLLQAMAHGDETLASLFPELFLHINHIEAFGLGIAARSSVDWNIVMRRFNALCDDLDTMEKVQLPKLLSLGNLFIGVRSRRGADLVVLSQMLPGIQASREADRRSNCLDNLHRIMLARLLYQHDHGTLPPAYTVNATGKPLHSWRVLLLPYLGRQELYGKLRLDEPWDSEHNRQFQDAAPVLYQCPSAMLKPGQTTYSVVLGERTAFRGGQGNLSMISA